VASQTAREKLLREKVEGEKPGVVPEPAKPQAQQIREQLAELEQANQGEIDELRREEKEVQDQVNDIYQRYRYTYDKDKLRGLLKELEPLTARQQEVTRALYVAKQAYRDLLYVDRPSAFRVKWLSRFTGQRKADITTGVEQFRRIMGKGTVDAATVQLRAAGRGRSSAGWDGKTLNLTTSAGSRTTIHEMGHWLEFNDPEVNEKAVEFYKRRTEGETDEWLGDNYSRRELTKRDRFLDPYMGKTYSRKGQIANTELVSMGLEYYWDEPVKLAKEDPEYFDFIFDLLRGR